MTRINSSFFLNNYNLEKLDIALCLTTLTCVPYANRHWTLAKETPEHALWHKGIAILEYIPIIGGCVAIVERIIELANSFFNTRQESIPTNGSLNSSEKKTDNPEETQINSVNPNNNFSMAGNATALEFISYVNPSLPFGTPKLTLQEAQAFLDRGGSLKTIDETKIEKNRITISKKESVITGCTSGINRSQVAAAVLIKEGISVKGVLAGGDSAMNLEAAISIFSNPNDESESANNFQKAFRRTKLEQIGTNKLNNFIEEEPKVEKAKEFYQNYINNLEPTYFITFSASGASVLRRLLKREGNLDGFTIVHFSWGDEIAHPPESSTAKSNSVELYTLFAEKFRNCFDIVD